MLMILSPAKTIDESIKNIDIYNNKFTFQSETQELVDLLKEFTVYDLCRLMKISDKLGILNYDRYKNFYDINSKDYTAILAFKGEAYKGLNASDFSLEDFKYADKTLRILSGLYGSIRPLNKIKPYRLEMGTKLKNNYGKDLYEFWGEKITSSIIESIEESPGENILLNLASKEYSSVLNMDKINKYHRVININFLDYKNGKYKMISMYAKRARGLMVRYIIQNKISTIEEIKKFGFEGYIYNEIMSKENEIVFTR